MTGLWESVERIPLACILLLIVTIQSAIAYTTLPDQAAEGMTSVVSVAGAEFGVFSALILLILFWVLIPSINRVYVWQFGGDAGGESDEA
jgi:uncharacterized membrane protein